MLHGASAVKPAPGIPFKMWIYDMGRTQKHFPEKFETKTVTYVGKPKDLGHLRTRIKFRCGKFAYELIIIDEGRTLENGGRKKTKFIPKDEAVEADRRSIRAIRRPLKRAPASIYY
jgi:hypothetical protein